MDADRDDRHAASLGEEMCNAPPVTVQFNPVWAALTGRQANIAHRKGDAARVIGSDAPMAALRDPQDPSAWDTLRSLLRHGEAASVMAHQLAVPRSWEVLHEQVVMQLVAKPTTAEPNLEASVFTGMELTDWEAIDRIGTPGPTPWSARIALRRRGRVIAIAGDRLKLEGWTEVAVSGTDLTSRGRSKLVRLAAIQAAAVRIRGDEPFVYVPADDVRLLHELQEYGFRVCATGRFAHVRPRN
jgi:hypothetical protein